MAFASFLLPFSARADIGLDFSCLIPATEFNCVALKERFFEAKIPFVKEGRASGGPQLKVNVGRVPVERGYVYRVTVSSSATEGSQTLELKVNDAESAAAVLSKVNGLIQRGVLAFAGNVGEATVDGPHASMTYKDPADGGSQPGPSVPETGRWTLSPSGFASVSKYGDLPFSFSGNLGGTFNYSGDRHRYQAGVNGDLNRQSVAVIEEDKPRLYGVNTYSAYAFGSASLGLDGGNRYNLGLESGIETDPLSNLRRRVYGVAGLEYNTRPFVQEDSKNLAFGCSLTGIHADLEATNIFGQDAVNAIRQGCRATAKLLLDKRGTSLQGSVGQGWMLTERSVFEVSGNLAATLLLTDRLSLSPAVNLGWRTKSIYAADPDLLPSLEGVHGRELAERQVEYSSQAASAEPFRVGGSLSLSYRFGEGATRSIQDQRGVANH